MSLARPDFTYLSDYIRGRSGIVLGEDKMYLIESRLLPVARAAQLAHLVDLVNAIRLNPRSALADQVIEAMTTNETSFFRDQKPFDQIRDVLLPAICQQPGNIGQPIRIWSAASSSGKEAYSLAMMYLENQHKFAGRQLQIVGTDLSGEMVTKAREGIYNQFEVQRGLPIMLLMKYFNQRKDIGECWQVKDNVRAMAQFSAMNLLDPYSAVGTFDIILCRNVLIYFNTETKRNILERLAMQLKPGGFIMLGSSETIFDITTKIKAHPDQRGVYQIA